MFFHSLHPLEFLLLGVGKNKYFIGQGDNQASVNFSTANGNHGGTYYGTYLVELIELGCCALVLIGYNSYTLVAGLSDANNYFDITVNAGDVSVISKNTIYPRFNVYRV